MDDAERAVRFERVCEVVQDMALDDGVLLLGAVAGCMLAAGTDEAVADWMKFVREARREHLVRLEAQVRAGQ
jgi:hypothetical protein